MAKIHGSRGQLYVGVASSTAAAESIAYIKSFDLSFSSDQQEVTSFGDTNKTYVVGLPDASGSFEGFYDTATQQTYTAAQDGQARRCYFYPTTPSTAGPYWYGTAFFDMDVDVPVDGVVAVSGSFMPATSVARVG